MGGGARGPFFLQKTRVSANSSKRDFGRFGLARFPKFGWVSWRLTVCKESVVRWGAAGLESLEGPVRAPAGLQENFGALLT